jgi:hypothetical protein
VKIWTNGPTPMEACVSFPVTRRLESKVSSLVRPRPSSPNWSAAPTRPSCSPCRHQGWEGGRRQAFRHFTICRHFLSTIPRRCRFELVGTYDSLGGGTSLVGETSHAGASKGGVEGRGLCFPRFEGDESIKVPRLMWKVE